MKMLELAQNLKMISIARKSDYQFNMANNYIGILWEVSTIGRGRLGFIFACALCFLLSSETQQKKKEGRAKTYLQGGG
jgi:hypothetical protein